MIYPERRRAGRISLIYTGIEYDPSPLSTPIYEHLWTIVPTEGNRHLNLLMPCNISPNTRNRDHPAVFHDTMTRRRSRPHFGDYSFGDVHTDLPLTPPTYSEIELIDHSYHYQYLKIILLTYSVEGQVSQSNERYLFISSFYQ